MKHKLRINSVIFFVTSILLITSCKKGKDGEPGKDGSSNVISRTFSAISSSWSNNGSRWYTFLSVPDLTNDNINSAGVQVFFSTSSNSWVAVPYTEVASSNYFMGFITKPNNVEVTWENNVGLGSNPNSFYSLTTVNFKVVVIPPAMLKANPDVNLNNYSEVKEKFNLKD